MAKAFGVALRNLRRAPAFTGLVVLTLALGIGSTTAMFSVVDAVLINPLPFPHSERFGEIFMVPEKGSARPRGSTALLNALARQTDLFTAVGAYQFGAANLTGDGEPEIIGTPQLSAGMLGIFGVQPVLGRWFTDEEAATGTVVLVGERLWRRRFGGDASIVGKTIMLDDRPHQVVGIMPDRFRFPTGTALMWRPIDTAPTAKPRPVQVITVRRPEVTRAHVNERLQALRAELRVSGIIPQTESITVDDLSLARPNAQTGKALYMLFGAVGLVLLVACVNVMNLLLVRGSARSGELALMSSLGASRGGLIGGVFCESLVLVTLGGAAGIALARVLLSMILAAAPRQMLFLGQATSQLDGRGLGFAIALAIATCLIFGVLPAWRAGRVDAIDVLKRRAQGVAGGDEWWQGALVAAQLALVVVLLAGSGLLLRSFGKLIAVDPGFDVEHIAVVDVPLPSNRYGAPGADLAFMRELERKVEGMGLRAVITSGAPPRGGGIWFDVKAETDDGRTIDLGQEEVSYSIVDPDYFSVLEIEIVDGRTFGGGDPVDAVIINTLMAKRFFGDTSPLGHRFRMDGRSPWMTVVGVAEDVKHSGPSETRNEMEYYRALVATRPILYFSFVVRAPEHPAAVVQMVKQKVWELDPKLPISAASTMTERLRESIARPRFYLTLAAAFAGLGALLGAIGVYGIAAYWVTRRRREIAIRVALGASRQTVMSMVIVRGLKLAAIGAVAGMTLAAAGTRFIESMLFGVTGRDPVTLTGVTVLLAVLVVLGCLVPALKAARVDPMTTLRAE